MLIGTILLQLQALKKSLRLPVLSTELLKKLE